MYFVWEIAKRFLLSQAYTQTSAAVSDADETVAIIYEEDDAAYFYTPLNDTEEKLWGPDWLRLSHLCVCLSAAYGAKKSSDVANTVKNKMLPNLVLFFFLLITEWNLCMKWGSLVVNMLWALHKYGWVI